MDELNDTKLVMEIGKHADLLAEALREADDRELHIRLFWRYEPELRGPDPINIDDWVGRRDRTLVVRGFYEKDVE